MKSAQQIEKQITDTQTALKVAVTQMVEAAVPAKPGPEYQLRSLIYVNGYGGWILLTKPVLYHEKEFTPTEVKKIKSIWNKILRLKRELLKAI